MAPSIRLWLELRGTGFECRPCRIFVIDVVHIQCSKLFKSMECAVISLVLCTKTNAWSNAMKVGIVPTSGLLLSRYCHDCVESDVKQYQPAHSSQQDMLSLCCCTTVGPALKPHQYLWADLHFLMANHVPRC